MNTLLKINTKFPNTKMESIVNSRWPGLALKAWFMDAQVDEEYREAGD